MKVEQKLQDAREKALHPLLKAVEDAVEAWARQSSNGALVWEIADEKLPAVWFWWDMAHRSIWWSPADLIKSLNEIAVATGDAGIGNTVQLAKTALLGYKD